MFGVQVAEFLRRRDLVEIGQSATHGRVGQGGKSVHHSVKLRRSTDRFCQSDGMKRDGEVVLPWLGLDLLIAVGASAASKREEKCFIGRALIGPPSHLYSPCFERVGD